jgi:hypothetical protein
MKLCLQRKYYYYGRAHAGRKDWPKEFSNPEHMELKRDEFRKLQHEDMTAVVRRDTWGALFLSTNMNPRIHHKVMKTVAK